MYAICVSIHRHEALRNTFKDQMTEESRPAKEHNAIDRKIEMAVIPRTSARPKKIIVFYGLKFALPG